MPTSDSLMGHGMPGELAGFLGNDPKTVTCAGSTQATATRALVRNSEITGASLTGVFISTNRMVGTPWYFFNANPTAVSVIVYAPVGDNLNGAASTTGLTLAQSKSAILFQYKKNNWASILTA